MIDVDRILLDKSIATAIKLYNIPRHHDRAFALITTNDGIKGVITFKVNNIWKVDAEFSMKYTREVAANILIKGSWN